MAEPGSPDSAPVDCATLAWPPPIGARPFTLCATAADCPWPATDFCYRATAAATGFCQSGDSDTMCDGEGDVNVQPDPPLPEWGPGMCAPHEWRDYMCCNYAAEWTCPS